MTQEALDHIETTLNGLLDPERRGAFGGLEACELQVMALLEIRCKLLGIPIEVLRRKYAELAIESIGSGASPIWAQSASARRLLSTMRRLREHVENHTPVSLMRRIDQLEQDVATLQGDVRTLQRSDQ